MKFYSEEKKPHICKHMYDINIIYTYLSRTGTLNATARQIEDLWTHWSKTKQRANWSKPSDKKLMLFAAWLAKQTIVLTQES